MKVLAMILFMVAFAMFAIIISIKMIYGVMDNYTLVYMWILLLAFYMFHNTHENAEHMKAIKKALNINEENS